MVYEVKEVDLTRLETFAEYFGESWQQQLVQGVASKAHQRWIQLIGEKLQTSRLAYRAALHPPEFDQQGRAVIRLGGEGGQFAVMVEEGADQYDLHDTILDGEPYKDVPFRHKGPTAGFASPGTPMGRQFLMSQGKAEALKIGRTVMRQASRLGPGQRLQPGLAPLLNAQRHSTDIFAAMSRIRDSNAKGAASRYVTWRRISKTNKDGTHWMHPGIRPHRLLDLVVADIEDIANHIADGLIEGILFYKQGGGTQ